MGLLGDKTDPTFETQKEHRHVLPDGKPRGVASENGTSFEEVGVKPSEFRPEEYDLESTLQEGMKARERGTWGSISSGSTEDPSASNGKVDSMGERNPTNVMDKVKKELKKPLLS